MSYYSNIVSIVQSNVTVAESRVPIDYVECSSRLHLKLYKPIPKVSKVRRSSREATRI